LTETSQWPVYTASPWIDMLDYFQLPLHLEAGCMPSCASQITATPIGGQVAPQSPAEANR